MYDYEICREEFDDSGNVCEFVEELAFASTKREAEKKQRRLKKEYPGDVITIRQYKEKKKEERHLVMVYE